MSYTLNLSNFSPSEMKAVIIGCLFVFFILLFKIFEQLKGTDFYSFVFPNMKLTNEQKHSFTRDLKHGIPRMLLSLVCSIAIYLLYEVYLKDFFN